MRRNFHVIRVNQDKADTYAAVSFTEARDLARPDDGDVIERATIEARDAGAARVIAGQLTDDHWIPCN